MAKSQDASQPQYQIIELKLILNEKCVFLNFAELDIFPSIEGFFLKKGSTGLCGF